MLSGVPGPAAGDGGSGSGGSSSLLDELAREGARRMLAEADAYCERLAGECDEDGHGLVVRHGYHQPEEVTSAGAIE